MKIDIQSTAPQPMTADQINNLAQFILTRKGNVDFGTTSVTVIPATGFSPDMAGIIVKASSGKVTISGATEYTDEEWNEIKAYGAPLWMVKAHDDYGISFGNLITAWGEWSNIQYAFHPNTDGKYGWMRNSIENKYVVTDICVELGDEYTVVLASEKTDSSYRGVCGGESVNNAFSIYSYNGNYALNEKTTGTKTATANSTQPMWIFANNRNGHLEGSSFIGRIGIISSSEHVLVPFYRDNKYGFLDLFTNKFYDGSSLTYVFD